MKPVFDLIQEIAKQIAVFFMEHDYGPSMLLVSPSAYRRLLELKSTEPFALAPMVGLRVIVDETMPDTEIMVAG